MAANWANWAAISDWISARQGGGEEVTEAGGGGVVGEFGVGGLTRWGDGGVRQGGAAVDKDEVEADAEGGMGAGQLDGGGGVRLVDHEAGGGEDAVAMGADDRLVDGGGAAKVIGVDYEAAHAKEG